MGKNAEYAAQHSTYAMEQMRRYGIPASVTLAQGILESSNGQSELSRKGNNHFGIKATSSWLKEGGQYLIYADDKPNEKFCSYASVMDSYEHHSKFLKENSRYSACFQCSPDDYKGWTSGLERAGYATGGNYAHSLQNIIERNGLDKYDRMVMEEMRTQGFTEDRKEHYSFPLKREEFLFITSPFGLRQDPMDKSKQQMHKGIDIQTRGDAVLATEDNGKVVAVNPNAQVAGGKSVTLEYTRPDKTKCQVSYLHLSSIDVKVGDTMQACQQLGVSGNTGTRTTGEHLHFGVKQTATDGSSRDIDPAAYLAEIAQKGNIKLQALSNGTDLLAKYKTAGVLQNETATIDTSISPEEWMKKLLSSEDSGIGMPGMDPIMELVTTMFTSLMALAIQIDGKSQEEQMQAATDAAVKKQVDLSSLLPDLKECTLTPQEDSKLLLQVNDGKNSFSHELSAAEIHQLQKTLTDSGLSDEEKRQQIGRMVNNIMLTRQVSLNYEQGASEQQSQSENRQIR